MPGRVAVVVRSARRLAPVAMEAFRRWDRLSPAEKERYRSRARDAGERARAALEQARRRKGRRGRR